MKLFVLLLTATMLFTSCGKKQTIRISAVNAVTGEPYAGLKYTIRKQTSGGFDEKNKTVEEGTLDGEGRAVVEMRLKNASYELNIQDPGNLCYYNNISYTFEKNSSNFDFQYKFAECGNFRLEVHNINCSNSEDKIYFFRTWQSTNESTPGSTQYGCFDFVGEYNKLSEGEYKYFWEVTRNNITTYFDTTFSISKGDNFSLVINY